MTIAPRALAALLALAAATPAVAAEPALYLHRDLVLSAQPPTQSSPRDDGEVSLLRRRSARIATFVSAPAPADAYAGDAVASLFLVTRRTAMEGCAEVGVQLFRLTLDGQRLPVGGQTVRTSVLRRRQVTGPVTVPMTVNGLLAAAGERLGLDIGVTNDCDGPRTVTLLYDSIDEASALVLTDLPGWVTTTTITSTTSTSVFGATTTITPASSTSVAPTTTTLPGGVPASCLVEPQIGFQRLLCRLDTIDVLLRAQPVPALGGYQVRKRIFLRLDRARALVAAAVPSGQRPRLLGRALRSIRRFDALVRQGARRGRIQASLASQVSGLAADAAVEMRSLRAAARGRLP